MKRSCFWMLLGLACAAHAQPGARAGVQTLPVHGAESLGRAGSGLALGSGWTLPALGGGSGWYGGQPFGLADLRYGAAHGHLATRWGLVGAAVQGMGLDGYRYTHARASWSGELRAGSMRGMAVGVGVNLWHLSFGAFGSGMAPGISLGVRYTLHPDLNVAVQADPLWGGQVAGLESVPARLQVGVGWRVHEALHLVADVVQEFGHPADVRGGMEWVVVPAFRLRGGMGHDPARAAAGASLHVGRWVAHLAADRHPVLGWTPALEVGLSW